MQAWSYWLSKHRGLGLSSVTPSCFPSLWVVLLLLHIIKCKENNERIKVRELAAKHRKTHTPPIVRGSIVYMSQIVYSHLSVQCMAPMACTFSTFLE